MLRQSEQNKNDTGPAFGPQYTRECVKDHTQPGDGVHPNLEGTSPLWRAAWVMPTQLRYTHGDGTLGLSRFRGQSTADHAAEARGNPFARTGQRICSRYDPMKPSEPGWYNAARGPGTLVGESAADAPCDD